MDSSRVERLGYCRKFCWNHRRIGQVRQRDVRTAWMCGYPSPSLESSEEVSLLIDRCPQELWYRTRMCHPQDNQCRPKEKILQILGCVLVSSSKSKYLLKKHKFPKPLADKSAKADIPKEENGAKEQSLLCIKQKNTDCQKSMEKHFTCPQGCWVKETVNFYSFLGKESVSINSN